MKKEDILELKAMRIYTADSGSLDVVLNNLINKCDFLYE